MRRINCSRLVVAAVASYSADASSTNAPSEAAIPAQGSSTSNQTSAFPPFAYKPRIRYTRMFLTKELLDFFLVQGEHVHTMSSTYFHAPSGVTMTLIPVSHHAHPKFFRQVDSLCCQHDSVLMEGRVPITGAPYSTLVPPRDFQEYVRPAIAEDSEGWEPLEEEKFWQPFSWGVKGSPKFTVVHAADKYDYEKLPWWASLRFNIPFVGNFAREKHCLNMVPHLVANGYKSFAVPWGAGHMPIFHDMLMDHGFEQIGSCSLILWSKIDGDHSAMWYRKVQHDIQQSKLYGKWVSRMIVAGFVVWAAPRYFWVEMRPE